jgi:hypothetical protein
MIGGAEAIVVNRLIRWARWKMESGVSLGYPSQVSFYRMAALTATYHDPAFDSECQETEKAVRSLPNDQYRLIRHEYIVSKDWKQHEKAEMLRVSPRTYRYWLKDAHRQVAMNLNLRNAQNAKNLNENIADFAAI